MSKYNYSGCGIGFDPKGTFLHPTGSLGNNAIIFGADMTSSIHSYNRANNILVLDKDFIQGINGTTIYAEKMYSVNLSATRLKLVLSLHYNGDNRYLFVNGKEMIKFKAKDSEIASYPFCLGNISKDFSNTNMEKTGLYGSVNYFSIDHNGYFG